MRVRFVHFPSSGSIPLRFFTWLRAMCVSPFSSSPISITLFCTMTREKYLEMDLEAINSPLSNLYDSTYSECFDVILENPVIQKLLFRKVVFIHEYRSETFIGIPFSIVTMGWRILHATLRQDVSSVKWVMSITDDPTVLGC